MQDNFNIIAKELQSDEAVEALANIKQALNKPLFYTKSRGVYDESIQESVVERVLLMAGKGIHQVSNPCITARESIALADYLVKLIKDNAK